MSDPTESIVIIGLPKSGNMFFSLSMQKTLGCIPFTFCTRANVRQQIMPEKLFEFISMPRAVGGQHLPPTSYNLRLLESAGICKIALLLRDPRDAIISWWHHLERSDHRGNPWHGAAMFAAGLQSRNYYDLGPHEKLRDLIDHMYPAMQQWIREWLETTSAHGPFKFHIIQYEQFSLEPRVAVESVLRFFGHTREATLPSITGPTDAGIHTDTHFRRGKIGSYRDEAPSDLVGLLDERLDPSLATLLQLAT